MGQAREILDRITAAVVMGDGEALGRLYAADAVAESPEGPRLEGRAAIVEYMTTFKRAFPDVSWESAHQHESGDTAIDEGYITGTHTGPLATPEGELAATGRAIRIRECDIVTVRDGLCVAHRFYFDQLEFLSQLGLTEAGGATVPGPRAAAEQTAGTSAQQIAGTSAR
jgi:ketosteroid isomerase-like protein